jgi:ketosteroid isomerase-like protein
MSQANIEIVTRSLDAYSRRDVELLRALTDPDVELDWSASHGFQAGVYKGFDTALGFYTEYFEVFDEIAIDIDGVTAVDDSVVVSNVARQRGRDGIEVTARSAFVFTVRDARIFRICLYQELDEALRAVGLEEKS